jgi:hypothetical protein
MKVKLFYTFLSLCVISLVFTSCADVKTINKPEGGITEIVPVSKTYSASHDKVWQAVKNVLEERGYIYEANPSSNTIKTEPQLIKGATRAMFVGYDYYEKLHIVVNDSTVSYKVRFDKKSRSGNPILNVEYPEKENELRKSFFEALDAKIGSPVTQIEKKQSSEIKEQPAQPTKKAQVQGEAKEADPSPPTLATVRKAKKEQGLDGYIFQDKNSKKFFLEDSDGNTYKFTGGQWLKMK